MEFEVKKALRFLFSSSVPGACGFPAAKNAGRNTDIVLDRKEHNYPPHDTLMVPTQKDANEAKRVQQIRQQLAGSLCSIRIAAGERGGTAYAIVDFSDETFASAALESVGEMPILPGTNT